ncbi:MAG: GAF domain-containing protein, partial [Saprospiraceae bacterium]|nr:GAF domain-containing protein [Saprospiraceae bacterium]
MIFQRDRLFLDRYLFAMDLPMSYWIDRIINRENPFEKLIHTISQFASEPIELDPFCELILDQLQAVFQPRCAGLFLKQKAAGRFHLVARLDLSIADMQFDLNHPLPVFFVQHSHLLHTSDIEIFPQFRALWAEEHQLLEQLNAVLYLPLKAGGELVGILSIGAKHSGRSYTTHEEKQLELLGNQAALVIRMKYAATAEARWRQEAESMQRAISDITNDCDLEEALLRNLNLLHDTLAYDTAYISLLEDGQLVVKSTQGYNHPEKIIGRTDPVEGNSIIQAIFESRQALLIEDTHLDQRFQGYAGPPVLRNWLGVPLINRGEVSGLLVLNGRKAKMFQVNPARLELVQAFANQAAVLVDKAHLYQIERQ